MSILERYRQADPAVCWEWPRARSAGGYGQTTRNGTVLYVHRLVFAEANSREPSGVVRHTCDNPPCYNPAHLLDGTRKENTHDSLRRMRQPKAKLDWEKVAQIRELYAQGGISQRALARQYGVSQSAIKSVIHHRSWPPEAAP